MRPPRHASHPRSAAHTARSHSAVADLAHLRATANSPVHPAHEDSGALAPVRIRRSISASREAKSPCSHAASARAATNGAIRCSSCVSSARSQRFLEQRFRSRVATSHTQICAHSKRRQTTYGAARICIQNQRSIFIGARPVPLLQLKSRAPCGHVKPPRIKIAFDTVGDPILEIDSGPRVVIHIDSAARQIGIGASGMLLKMVFQRQLKAALQRGRPRSSPAFNNAVPTLFRACATIS